METQTEQDEEDWVLRCPLCGYTKIESKSKNNICKCKAGMVRFRKIEEVLKE